MSATPRQWFGHVWTFLQSVAEKFVADNGFFYTSALAFNILLYFIPLSLLMVSLLGYTVLDSERAMNEVKSVLQSFLPQSQQAMADSMAAVVADRGLLGVAGVVSFVVFSSLLFGSVRIVLNQVFRAQRSRTFIRGVGIDLFITLLVAALLLGVVINTSFVTIVWTLAEDYPSLAPFFTPALTVWDRVLGFVAMVALFYVLYRVAPAIALPYEALLIGALSATLLFQLARWGFAWYVSMAQASLVLYGTLGGLMFFFMWLYYASLVFILGAEVAWFCATRSDARDHGSPA
ncbi:MAG: YihY/virulence factor BrkB family protein [Nitrospira sp.]|nr:YihY/virulence factor BrkB family protein [Nitrospira sp.]